MINWRKQIWAAPILAAAVALAVASLVDPPRDAPGVAPGTVAVDSVTYACPVQKDWTVASGQISAGDAAEATAVPDAQVSDRWARADRWRSGTAEPGTLIVTQTGSGTGAVGFVAGRFDGGDVAQRCPGVVDDAWFTGLGATRTHDSRLALVNLGPARAVVDLRWWSTAGPIDSADASGVVIEPGTRTIVAASEVAAGEELLGVEVLRQRGEVSAVVLDSADGDLEGSELLAAAGAPGREQVLGGISTRGDATLQVTNPGTSTAHVKVDVLGADGSFLAEGLDDLAVDPESVQEFEVPARVDIGGAALRLTSDQPVVSSLRVSRDDDYAVSTPSPRLDGPAIVPVDLGVGTVALTLAAPGAAASATIEGFDRSMTSTGSTVVDLAAGGSQTVDPLDDLDSAAYVVVRPTGDVRAAAFFATSGRLASMPVSTAPLTVRAPHVEVR